MDQRRAPHPPGRHRGLVIIKDDRRDPLKITKGLDVGREESILLSVQEDFQILITAVGEDQGKNIDQAPYSSQIHMVRGPVRLGLVPRRRFVADECFPASARSSQFPEEIAQASLPAPISLLAQSSVDLPVG